MSNRIVSLIVFIVLVSPGISLASGSDSWYRDTALSPDGSVILFTHRGDIYRVPSNGGVAVPITSSPAVEGQPVWSPDGKQIAYTSDRHGNLDVFVIPADGGHSRRLTFHEADDMVSGFSPDGARVVFTSTRYNAPNAAVDPQQGQPELYEVAVNGGTPVRLLTFFASQARWSPDGEWLLYADDKDETFFRKHDDSPFARDVWRMNRAEGTFEQLTTNEWNDHTPSWDENGSGFYFISERSGTLNVWHQAFDGGEASARQLTRHQVHPVRDLSVSDSGDIAYNWFGQVYFATAGSEPAPVEVIVHTVETDPGPLTIEASDKITEFAVSPDGKEVAYIVRGDIFATSLEFDSSRQITHTPGEERNVVYSDDGRSLLYASQRMDQWRIYESRLADDGESHFYLATRIEESLLIEGASSGPDGDDRLAATHPAPSHDGKKVAYLSDWAEVRVFDRKKRQSVTVVGGDLNYSLGNNSIHYDWSPDDRWITVDIQPNGRLFFPNIAVVPADGSSPPVDLTRTGYTDAGPRWHRSGGIITWTTGRFGSREHGGHGTQYDVYAQFLSQDAWDTFRQTKEDLSLAEKKKPEDSGDEDETDEPVSVSVDLERAGDRQARLTIHSSDLADFQLNKDGSVLYYLSAFEKGYDLWKHDFREQETVRLVTIGAKSARMELLADDSVAVVLADGKLNTVGLEGPEFAAAPVPIAVKSERDPEAERAAMLHHVWQTTRDRIYLPDVLQEADWDAMYTAYAGKVSGVGNNRDFAEMVDELVGELDVSHAAGRYRGEAGDQTGFIGAVLDFGLGDDDGVSIAYILTQGPLARASDRAAAGNRIVAVNDQRIDADTNFWALMNNTTGTPVRLTLKDRQGEFDVILKPVPRAEETAWLMDHWIETRHALVDELSGGRLGYVYIPQMSDSAYRRVYADIFGRDFAREAIVIDVRDNRGGDLVDWLVQLFSGEQYMTNVPDGRPAQGEPITEWVKPSIALTNQAAYSDGHCFVAAWTNLGISTLVGTPVTGTCTYAGWEMLLSGDVLAGTPRLGILDPEGDWLERKTTHPDVLIYAEPAGIEQGRDVQLEKAVEVMLQELDSRSP